MSLRRATVFTIMGNEGGPAYPVMNFTDKEVAEKFLKRLNDHLAKRNYYKSEFAWWKRNPLGVKPPCESYNLYEFPLITGSESKSPYVPSPPTLMKMKAVEARYNQPFNEWFVERVTNGHSLEWLYEETEMSWYGIKRLLKQHGLKLNGYGCAYKVKGGVCVTKELKKLGITEKVIKFRIYRNMKKGLSFDRALTGALNGKESRRGTGYVATNDHPSQRTHRRNKMRTSGQR